MKVLKENKNNTIKTKTCQPSLFYLNISKTTSWMKRIGESQLQAVIKEKNCRRKLRGWEEMRIAEKSIHWKERGSPLKVENKC